MNTYYFKARLIPTVLTMIPLTVLYIYQVSPILAPILDPVWDLLPVFTGVAINVCVMFLLVLLNRFISKVIFQHLYYQDDLQMPSTDYLLPNNLSLDSSSRNRYYALIMKDFGIDMSKELETIETEKEKRIMISRIVGQIRNMLRGNDMLLQHNIEYGFWRNLIGGCVIALLVSIVLVIISIVQQDKTLMYTSIVMLVLYVLPILFSKVLIKSHGKNYASVLFEQYASIKRA